MTPETEMAPPTTGINGGDNSDATNTQDYNVRSKLSTINGGGGCG